MLVQRPENSTAYYVSPFYIYCHIWIYFFNIIYGFSYRFLNYYLKIIQLWKLPNIKVNSLLHIKLPTKHHRNNNNDINHTAFSQLRKREHIIAHLTRWAPSAIRLGTVSGDRLRLCASLAAFCDRQCRFSTTIPPVPWGKAFGRS